MAANRNSITTEQMMPVESIQIGEFVRRKEGAKATYRRGEYCKSTKRYALDDYNDASRQVWVRKGTLLFVGFDY